MADLSKARPDTWGPLLDWFQRAFGYAYDYPSGLSEPGWQPHQPDMILGMAVEQIRGAQTRQATLEPGSPEWHVNAILVWRLSRRLATRLHTVGARKKVSGLWICGAAWPTKVPGDRAKMYEEWRDQGIAVHDGYDASVRQLCHFGVQEWILEERRRHAISGE